MTLLQPRIDLCGIKALCIDDIIAGKKTFRNNFLLKSRLSSEDVFFADAFNSSLDILDSHPEISLAFIDMRIPKSSEDGYDFNPDAPGKEWGKQLIEEIPKRYPNRELYIIVITAYTRYEFPQGNTYSPVTVQSVYEKPVDYKSLIQDIEFVINKIKKSDFDYSFLTLQDSQFIQETTQEIRKRLTRIGEDIIAVGNFLLEVRQKLQPMGKYRKWLKSEFRWSDRQARRYTNAAIKFAPLGDRMSLLDIDRTAYWVLSENKTTEEAVEEVLTIAERGVKITPKIVEEVREKHIKSKKNARRKSVTDKATSSTKESQTTNKKTPTFEVNKSKQKQEILAVYPIEKAVKNSWWQLGENHQLFCGEPSNSEFIKYLPENIALTINLLPKNDLSLIPSIKADSHFIYCSQHSSSFEAKKLDSLEDIIFKNILLSTLAGDNIVFAYVFQPDFFNLGVKLECQCFAAEPDLEKCEQILEFWRDKRSVKRIKH